MTIEEGPEAYDPPPRWDGRPRDSTPSGADAAVCYYLARAGLTDDQIRGIYKTFPIGARGKYSRKGRGDQYLKRTIGAMRGKLSEERSATLKTSAKADAHGEELPRPEETGTLLSEVEAERVGWLWEGRLALGKLALIDGDPGLGKSAMVLDLAAGLSAGMSLPDKVTCEPAGVVLLSAEDGLSDTIRPRVDAAGGDPSKILALATVPDEKGHSRLLSIPEDIPVIERGVRRVEARLVVVDPLMAFLSGGANSHRDQDVRRALAPLARLAEGTGAAVAVVRHLNKGSGGNPLYRGGGSIGIIGAARTALLVAKHPDDEGQRVLAPLKSNLSRPARSLAFVLAEANNGAVRVEWKGETSHTADTLLAAPTDPEERSALGEAMEFLREALKDAPVESKDARKSAREAGVSEATLRRAKAALGVRSTKAGDGSWSWALPPRNEGEQDA